MAEMALSVCNAAAKDAAAFVAREEERYRRQIRDVAEQITAGGVCLLLLAGPSASGKTTTANLLADALRAGGHRCEVVSLDDFYRRPSDPAYPRLPDGTRDFECVESLELPLLAACLSDILAGRPFSVPHFDFRLEDRAEKGRSYEPLTDGCVIAEGLHALNPLITDALPREKVLRLFVSLSTNLTDDAGARMLSGKKMRFVRRLVRDSLYRNASAERTYRLWRNVLAGEEKFLYPFRGRADLYFDTFHAYEPGVMRAKALPLLAELPQDDPTIAAVTETLSRAMPVAESLVPPTSLLREFLAGGVYDALY